MQSAFFAQGPGAAIDNDPHLEWQEFAGWFILIGIALLIVGLVLAIGSALAERVLAAIAWAIAAFLGVVLILFGIVTIHAWYPNYPPPQYAHSSDNS